MFSVKEVSGKTLISEERLYKLIKRHNLGQKVGFGWVLFQKDVDYLNNRFGDKNNGNKKAA